MMIVAYVALLLYCLQKTACLIALLTVDGLSVTVAHLSCKLSCSVMAAMRGSLPCGVYA